MRCFCCLNHTLEGLQLFCTSALTSMMTPGGCHLVKSDNRLKARTFPIIFKPRFTTNISLYQEHSSGGFPLYQNQRNISFHSYWEGGPWLHRKISTFPMRDWLLVEWLIHQGQGFIHVGVAEYLSWFHLALYAWSFVVLGPKSFVCQKKNKSKLSCFSDFYCEACYC